MVATRGFGFKNRNTRGFSLGKEVPKFFFGLQWPRLLASQTLPGTRSTLYCRSRTAEQVPFRGSKGLIFWGHLTPTPLLTSVTNEAA